MPFPHHDANWTGVADFLGTRMQPGARLLAPDLFWWLFPKIVRYPATAREPETSYDWSVIHKGELGSLSGRFLRRLVETQPPVFANPVFVVFSPHSADRVSSASPHLVSFNERLATFPEDHEPSESPDPDLPDSAAISNFAYLSDAEIAEAMDRFWEKGGYVYETVRDQAYSREMDRCATEGLAEPSGHRLLDVACGSGRLAKMASAPWLVTGLDISRVAIDLARRRHAHLPNFRFEVGNAQALAFDDASFDVVLFIDAIEHVRDADVALGECARVLRPGGRFVTTVANSQGLNQILMRKLGYPGFVTNYQHIREFSYAESLAMLKKAGLELVASRGIFLYPYWGIPGIDDVVRHLTDDDPDVVELMRVLGERVGPEYAYAFSLVAVKP